jgi:uncharacterized protein YaeQ
MALPSILHHLDLQLVDVDRGVERTLALKVARHPSETVERLWLRVLALAWRWEEGIAFGPGLCEPEACDLLAARPDGTPALVVRVGKPDVDRVARDIAQNTGARVAVLFEGPRRMDAFVAEARERAIGRLAKVELAAVDPPLLAALAGKDDRRIKVAVTLVTDHLYMTVGAESLDGPLHRASVS